MITPGSFTLLWPSMLWLLLLVPVLVAAYWWLLARRRAAGNRFAHLEMVWQVAGGAGTAGTVGSVAPPGILSSPPSPGQRPQTAQHLPLGQRVRAHLPAVLVLLALTSLIFAISRPQASLMLPSRVDSVVLALDMSGSMRASDLQPNRLVAAQNAAKAFVDEQPPHTRVGVVAVAATAAVVQSPTHKREEIIEAIDRLAPQRGTALGSGLVISLATALPSAGIDVDKFINSPGNRPNPGEANRRGDPQQSGPGSASGAESKGKTASKPQAEPVAPGSNNAAAIVLLSDGQSNVGPDPMKAAELAADLGVRVFTVGVGTTEGISLTVDGWTSRVRLDEEALKKIAAITHGEYFRAGNAAELKKIYQYLSARLTLEKKTPTEITALFIGLGAGLAMLAALLSMWWFNRVL